MKVAVVVGHNSQAKGAKAPAPINKYEFDFNNEIADEMIKLSSSNMIWNSYRSLEVIRINREKSSGYSKEIEDAYAKVDDSGADISIELHFNSASPSATGIETLSSGSTKSLALCRALQDSMLAKLKLRDRGVKILSSSERGGKSLHTGNPPAALVEPFFASNSGDVAAAHALGTTGFAKMYLDGVLAYAKGQGKLDEDPASSRNLFVGAGLQVDNLTKPEFFSRNYGALKNAIDSVNFSLEESAHGEDFVPLTLQDAFATMNAEMALKSGKANPDATHSLGEKGLFPLPSNLAFWNGDQAPANGKGLSVEENVSEFLFYLGNLKNKDVWRPFGWGNFYESLFDHVSTKDDPAAQYHLVAAAIHGWFLDSNFTGNPDFNEIAEKAAKANQDPDGVIEALQNFGYKHGADLLTGRLSNVEAGAALVKSEDQPTPAPGTPVVVTPTPGAPAEPEPTPSAPAEPTPAPSAPAQPTPAPSAPAQPTPAPSAPAQPTSAPSAPAQPTSTPSAPAQPTSTPSAPAQPTSTPSAPAQPTSTPSAPAQPTPPPSAPTQPAPPPSAPAQPMSTPSAPAQPAPTPSAPAQPTPAPSAPAQPTSTPSAPAQPAPTPSAPAQPAPTPSAPAQPAPTPSAPAQPASTPSAPAQPAPTPSAPTQPAPTPSAPAQPAPTPSAPAQPAPTPSAPAQPTPPPSVPTQPPAPSTPPSTDSTDSN